MCASSSFNGPLKPERMSHKRRFLLDLAVLAAGASASTLGRLGGDFLHPSFYYVLPLALPAMDIAERIFNKDFSELPFEKYFIYAAGAALPYADKICDFLRSPM